MDLPLLVRGSKGAAVENLQTLLNARLERHTLVPLKVDGDFGGLTETRLAYYLAHRGLPLVPKATTPQVWAALLQRLDPLAVDLYKGDGRTKEQVRRLSKAGAPWHVFWAKATQGTYYHSDPWLSDIWPVANGREDGDIAERMGIDYFTLLYAYWVGRIDPVKQAHTFLAEYDRVGRGGPGYIGTVIDVEEGDQPEGLAVSEIVDGVSKMAQVIKAETGKSVIRYSGWWLAAKAPRNRMGCDLAWIAAYSAKFPLHSHVLPTGFDLASTLAWQYCGDGQEVLADYPGVSPGTGPEDISAMIIDGGGQAALARMQKMAKGPL